MEKSGELGGSKTNTATSVIGGIEKPKPVSGIKATQTPKRTYFMSIRHGRWIGIFEMPKGPPVRPRTKGQSA
jgi:hypothetical protein